MYPDGTVPVACSVAMAFCLLAVNSSRAEPSLGKDGSEPRLLADIYDSGFAEAHDTYNGMGTGSDGKVYYVLCGETLDIGAKMFVFDPATNRTRLLGDLTEVCGEKGQKTIPQGKSHANFYEHDGKLYFTTHVGYYTTVDGLGHVPVPPPGYKPYPGGHLLSYDMATGKFEDFGVVPSREGLITFAMDGCRQRCYALTWPSGRFVRFDLRRREWKDFGAPIQPGEEGEERTYHAICRAIAVSPEDGSAYFTVSTGIIFRYRNDRDAIEKVTGEDLCKDYFGQYDPHAPGHMGYNWRQAFWHPEEHCIYGVHGNSGYLFRFDPKTPRVEVLTRLTSLHSQRSGMFDQFSYGYLGFTLGPDHRTLYYLTGGPIYHDGNRVAGKSSTVTGEAKGLENLHLVTYDLPTACYQDHGAVFYANGERPTWVNSIAIGKDGTVYSLARATPDEHGRADLIRIRLPAKAPFSRLSGSASVSRP